MPVTRKSYIEVWPEGASAYSSRHTQEREAIEAAGEQGPGTHEIRIDGGLYLTVTVPHGTTEGPEFVYTTTETFTDPQRLSGATVTGPIWVWYAAGGQTEFTLNNQSIGLFQPISLWSGELSEGSHVFSDGNQESRFMVDAVIGSIGAGVIGFEAATTQVSGGGTVVLAVNRTGGEGAVAVDYSIVSAEFPDLDASETIEWADGVTVSQPLSLGIADADGTVTLTLSNPRRVDGSSLSLPVLGISTHTVTSFASIGGNVGDFRPDIQIFVDAGAAMRYVDIDSGSNSNDGLSRASAWLTLDYGMQNVPGSGVLEVGGTTQNITTSLGGGGNGVLRVANEGTSIAPTIVVNRKGHTPTFTQTYTGSGSGVTYTTEQRDNVWLEGLGFHKNGLNGDILKIGTTSRGCKLRHCTLSGANLRGNTDGTNDAAIMLETSIGSSTHRRDNIIEYNTISGLTGTDTNNTACILLYDNHGGIVRYNDLEAGSNGCKHGLFIKVQGKQEYYAQPEQVYRNRVRSGGMLVSLSSSENQIFTNNFELYENIVENGSIAIGSRIPGTSVDYTYTVDAKIYNNTVVGGTFFAAYSQERTQWGADISFNGNRTRPEGFQHYNNIAATTGNSISTRHDEEQLGAYPHGEWNEPGFPNYNGFATSSFVAQYRIPGVGDDYTETFIEWQGHGYDSNSIVASSAGFVDELGGDYNLTSGSAFKGTGTSDGTPSGTSVDMGALYLTDWTGDVGASPWA